MVLIVTSEMKTAVAQVIDFDPDNLEEYIKDIVDAHAVDSDEQLAGKLDKYKVRHKRHDMITEIAAVLAVRNLMKN